MLTIHYTSTTGIPFRELPFGLFTVVGRPNRCYVKLTNMMGVAELDTNEYLYTGAFEGLYCEPVNGTLEITT